MKDVIVAVGVMVAAGAETIAAKAHAALSAPFLEKVCVRYKILSWSPPAS